MRLTLVVLMVILSLAAFRLMIIQGDYYREVSDNKRIKDILVKAPRGNIYDRNGKLLAGTRPSFTAQLLADDIGRKDPDENNKNLLELIGFLEGDGVDYGENSPIESKAFVYAEEADYYKEDMIPEDKVLKLILDQDLVPEIFNRAQEGGFSPASRALNALETKGIIMPVRIESNQPLKLKMTDEDDYKDFLKRQGLEEGKPEEVLLGLIKEDETVIRRLLNHPESRELVYGILEDKKLSTNIQLEDYVLKADRMFIENKAQLHKLDKRVNVDSDPKDDFVNLTSKYSLPLLLSYVDTEEGKEPLVPAEILISMLEKKTKKDLTVQAVLGPEDTVKVDFIDEEKKNKEKPMDYLIRLAKEEGVLENFITDKRIVFLAQEANTQAGILPNISVIEWEYISTIEKEDLIKKYKSKSQAPTDVLAAMAKYYSIEEIDNPHLIKLIQLYIDMEKQGHLSYQPLNVAYGLNEETVAKIEEQIGPDKGIQISAEPVRFYPEGTRAAHALGYVGKIAQPDEIKEFIEDKGYTPGELIGKTGMEEAFESILKGEDGKTVVEVDSSGNKTSVLKEIPPIRGSSLYLSVDLDLQRVAEDALRQTLESLRAGENFQSKWGEGILRINEREGRPHTNANSGAVVVLDVHTGEILAMANEKTYDPNLFSTGISESDWKSLFPVDDTNPLADRPLLNVAMQTEVAPGSIFKLLTSLTALEKGLSADREILDSGAIEIGDHTFGCWMWNQGLGTHGWESMYGAIQDSCNYYYYMLAMGQDPHSGDDIGMTVGVEDIRAMAIKLGLDEPTGLEINIPYEASGRMPDPEEKRYLLKVLLEDFLDENLKDFLPEKLAKNEREFDSIKEAILTLLDEDLDRDTVYDRIEELGLDMQKTFANGDNFSDRIKYSYMDQSDWNLTDMLNVVIGQGQNAYTPLQMANYVSIFANGGYRNTTSLVKEVRNWDDSQILLNKEPERFRVPLNDYDHLSQIGLGMNMAAKVGTLDQVFGNFPVEVALKTGTAERDGINPETKEAFDDYSWMVAFAPYDDPQIAICTLLYQAGSGSNGAVIVREVVGEYLKLDPNSHLYDEYEEEILEEDYNENDYVDYEDDENLDEYNYPPEE